MKTKTRSIAIWSAVAIVGAVAWGVIALVRDEEISAAWLILAAVGVVRDRLSVLRAVHRVQGAGRGRQARDARRAPRERRRLPADRPARAVRPPLRRDRGRRAARRPRARRPDGLPAGDDLDRRRRDLRRRGAGHGRPVLLDAPRRQEPRADGARRDRAGRRRRGAGRRAGDHGDPARRARARRGQRAGELAVGHVQPRDDDPDRVLHGLLHARAAARPRAGDHRDRRDDAADRDRARRRGAGLEPRRRVHARARDARLLPDRLRLHRLGPAGVDAARPARLPLDLHEDRDDHAARDRHPRDAAGDEERGGHEVRLTTARAPSSPARCSRSSSSRSRAARCPASTR